MVHIRHMKKGDVLVKEGDSSNSMYWVQSGTLRLYKKKGSGFIELGVVHSGEVVGELSFLDNQPRSASVEALQPCDIIEIPRGKFEEFINTQPSWMKSLVQTLVKRLRSTNNRVKELESASTVYSKDDEGRTTKVHEFLSNGEQLKLCSAVLMAGLRYAEKQPDGSLKCKAGWIQLFGGHIANIHLSKVTTFLEMMQEAGLVPRAVSFQKGCYVGQEVVCTLEMRGHVKRVSTRVRFEGTEAPARGDDIWRDGVDDEPIGRVTSVVVDPGDGALLVLGMLKRNAVEPGVRVHTKSGIHGEVLGPAT
ncbi:MAG: cyclic nucleotide-binding domain-containing protein [Bdellovibrionales bacterium]|nr:cyclic nucleotide-binding domain-containing protein [Bdellovibrionales bacterium]